MENLRIATWNIKNGCFNILKNEIKVAAVMQLLKYEKPDFLSLQGINSILAKKIDDELIQDNSDYRVTSNYKVTMNPIRNLKINYNLIISNLESITSSCNEKLSSLPKGFELIKKLFNLRICKVTSQIFEGRIIVNNTCLDSFTSELGKRQVKQIEDLMKYQHETCGYDTVLTCAFNSNQNHGFADYSVETIGFEVLGVKELENYGDISSYKPLIATIKRR